jgi:hypothetical protein
MIKIRLARIIAVRSRARFVDIQPRRGVRVGDAMRKLREEDAQRISALLEAEQERLIRAWENHSGARESQVPTALPCRRKGVPHDKRQEEG